MTFCLRRRRRRRRQFTIRSDGLLKEARGNLVLTRLRGGGGGGASAAAGSELKIVLLHTCHPAPVIDDGDRSGVSI